MRDNSSNTDSLQAQKESWLAEQRDIASKVIVYADDDHDDATITTNHPRFARIPLMNHQNNNNEQSRRYYGGVDVSFPQDGDEHDSVAVYVVVDATTMQVVYQDAESFALDVPYIPSFLAFREIQPLQRLVEKQLRDRPELTPAAILVDGNGLLHSRCAGIACFLGVRTNIPTIGIGKTLFCEGGLTKQSVSSGMDQSLAVAVNQAADVGADNASSSASDCVWMDTVPIKGEDENDETQSPPGLVSDPEATTRSVQPPDRGALVQEMAPLCKGYAVPLFVQAAASKSRNSNQTVACALVGHGGRVQGGNRNTNATARVGSKVPIFVSVGHKMSLQQAVAITAFLSIARIPEPVRQADLIGRRMLRNLARQRQKQQEQNSNA